MVRRDEAEMALEPILIAGISCCPIVFLSNLNRM